MTEMQILRNALFDEIARVKRGTANTEDTKMIIASANAITQTYNTELKACDTMIRAKELGFDPNTIPEYKNYFTLQEKLDSAYYDANK